MLEAKVNVKNEHSRNSSIEILGLKGINTYIEHKKSKFAQQTAQLLSFIKAFKIVAMQEQLTTSRKGFLIEKLLLIQQQLSIFGGEIGNDLDLVVMEVKNHKAVKLCLKQINITIALAITATDRTNATTLNIAINTIEEELQKLQILLYENNNGE